MKHIVWMFLLAALCRPLAAADPPPAPAADPAAAIAALEATFGPAPGQRRNHRKGSCATGDFVGNRALQAWSRSALFSATTIPVVARFSLAGGNPQAPDTARSPRGMALQFQLGDGRLHQMAMLSTPMFGAATPASFIDQISAMTPNPATGKPDPAQVAAFRASHPDNAAQTRFLAEHNPPQSYASSAYFGIHTFMLVAGDGRKTPVRWQFVPRDGELRLSDDELARLPADFLEQRLLQRSARGPVLWDLQISFAEPEDRLDDPSVSWPETRKSLHGGTLSLREVTPQQGASCAGINFDPMVMADGIAPSADPVLQFRSPSYALSFARRTAGQ